MTRLSNPEVLSGLPSAAPAGQRIYAYLISESDSESDNADVFKFLMNPERLQWARGAAYSEAKTAGTSVQTQQYSHTNGRTLKIPGLILETHYEQRTITPLIERLQTLLQPQTNSDWLAPPVLGFVWGAQQFQPCILTDVTWEETAWIGGAPTAATVDLALKEIPPPDVAPSDRLVSSDVAPADGALLAPLTDRQQTDAASQATGWLNSNARTLTDSVRDRVLSGTFSLSTTATTGAVDLLDQAGTVLGTVGRWDGRAFTTENQAL